MDEHNMKLFTGKARLRARDIRERFKSSNVDPAIVTTLETLAEQDGTLRKQIEMLADLVNGAVDQVLILQQVMGKALENIPMLKHADAAQQVKNIALDRIKLTDGEEG